MYPRNTATPLNWPYSLGSILLTTKKPASMLIMLPPIGLPGVLVYLKAAQGFPWHVAGGVALGFAVGAFFGARLATRLSGPRLQRLFAAVMVLLALMLFVRR